MPGVQEVPKEARPPKGREKGPEIRAYGQTAWLIFLVSYKPRVMTEKNGSNAANF
jgi:hypothetical protein